MHDGEYIEKVGKNKKTATNSGKVKIEFVFSVPHIT
jgi:hypothetical protein